MSPSSLSTTMLQRIVSRDAQSWQRVFQLFGPTVYSRCRRCGLQEEDAADVVQEVFMAALKSIDNFKREDGNASFRAWLLGIAGNKLKDYWDGRAKHPQGEGGSDARRRFDQVAAPGEESSVVAEDAAEKAGLLRRALEMIQGEFQERTWKAFWRFEIDGQPAAEVAAELGMSPNAVHVAVCRVRKRLREEFAGLI